ncbi:unnamed protein product [Danaus chrysippus]|uniref:(African queen) hypothetical protein n=1 Tax=Danaus chrysippus TaxID=151541 RepID=A0A8J2QW94_9NEOP|nr:unnamed protein product [Danaus chrysippus]
MDKDEPRLEGRETSRFEDVDQPMSEGRRTSRFEDVDEPRSEGRRASRFEDVDEPGSEGRRVSRFEDVDELGSEGRRASRFEDVNEPGSEGRRASRFEDVSEPRSKGRGASRFGDGVEPRSEDGRRKKEETSPRGRAVTNVDRPRKRRRRERCAIYGRRAVDCMLHGIDDRAIRVGAQAAQFSEPEQVLKYFRAVKVGQSRESFESNARNKNDRKSSTNPPNRIFTPKTGAVNSNIRYVVEDTPMTRKNKRRYEAVIAIDKMQPWLTFSRDLDSGDDRDDCNSENGLEE